MLRFAQHDIDEVGHIVTQPLEGERFKSEHLESPLVWQPSLRSDKD